MKRTRIITPLLLVLVLGLATPAFAHGNDDSEDHHATENNIPEIAPSVGRLKADSEEKLNTAGGRGSLQDATERLRTTVGERQAGLEQRIKSVRENRTTMLEDRRLARCQNREDRINELVREGARVSSVRYEQLQRFESNVKSFYESNKLSSDDYTIAARSAAEARLAAGAVHDTLGTLTFECESADGLRPSAAIRLTVEARRDTMRSYRDAVKELYIVVREAVK